MECEDKKNICSLCIKKDTCKFQYGICNGLECPINAFNEKNLEKANKCPRIDLDKLIESFFDESKQIPEEYENLKKEYLQAKSNLGSSCSSCQLNSLRRYYKQKLMGI